MDIAFAMLMLFEKQKLQYFARRHSLKITVMSFKKSKSGNQGKGKDEIFMMLNRS
ncbi:MAG: hypothetical protein ACRC9I_06775 [Acinetobacter sp.]|jgi:hypothetical protein